MIGFVFPGQGAQYLGMGKDLYQAFEGSRKIFNTADKILGFSLSQLCFAGPLEELTRTVNCQPAVFTTSLAALTAFNKLTADYTAGLSLGEYTALVAAQAISFEDGLNLVAARAKLMEEAAGSNPGRMSSILGLDLAKVQEIAQESGAEVANLNCPGQVVISGKQEAIEQANKLAIQRGAKRAINLEVSGAFHSSLMQSAAQELSGILNNIQIKPPKVAVVSNVTALPENDPGKIRNNLVRQLTSSVYWEKSVRFMIEQGVNKFFEIGPGKVLRGLIRKIDPNVEVVNIVNKQDIDSTSGG